MPGLQESGGTRSRLGTAALLVALALGGCSDSKEATGGTATTVAPETTTTSVAPIVPTTGVPALAPPPPPPTTAPRSAARRPATAATPRGAAGASVPDCAQAEAIGAAPLYRGDPGYNASLDPDGDGVACDQAR